MAQMKHYHHHFHLSYNTSFKRHFSSIGIVLLILTVIFLFILGRISPADVANLDQLSILDLFKASFATLFRLTVAYSLALVFSIPLTLLITSSPRVERVLLPIFDIIQSVPVLAFFPIIVLAFIKFNFFDGAAIFVLFMAMVWNLVFNMIGGIKSIPADVELASKVYEATGFKKLTNVTLPAIIPYIITGSLLAWGQGWNIMIVAEVLHTYIPGGNPSQDLFGLGSLLVNALSSGKTVVFLGALGFTVIIIGFLNFFVWQKLLSLTQRYKFD